jgi:hypothetical protein
MMNHIKTFENFDQQPKRYLFYITKESATEFEAEVKTEDGSVIYKLDKDKIEKKKLMTNSDDMTTLRAYLIKIKKLGEQDELQPAEASSSQGFNSENDAETA